MIPIPRDFLEFLELLDANAVKYVIIGGYAVAYHGYVRFTGDIDIFVPISPATALKLTKVFNKFGFNAPNVTPALFLRKGKIIRIGHEPMRLEVLNEIDGVSFEDCYKTRKKVRCGKVKINFVDLAHLLKNKKASGRQKDLADIEGLTQRKLRRKSKSQ
jgi:Nucleotidyl transferase of unknown function (DUF2204)